MPAPADLDPGATPTPTTSGRNGPQINPSTGLSTDYLNHFTEALMALEMAGSVPECLDDLREWQPKTYPEHFAGSRFSNRDAIVAAYFATDPPIRILLDRMAKVLNALVARSRDLACQQTDAAEIEVIARRGVARLRPLIAQTAALINGTADEATRRGPQAQIDAMFAR